MPKCCKCNATITEAQQPLGVCDDCVIKRKCQKCRMFKRVSPRYTGYYFICHECTKKMKRAKKELEEREQFEEQLRKRKTQDEIDRIIKEIFG